MMCCASSPNDWGIDGSNLFDANKIYTLHKMSHFQTTTPGFRDKHGQIVISRTGFPSESFSGQTIYHLRCAHCDHNYGCAGKDIHLRRCPRHQEGAKGESLRTPAPNLFLR